MDKSEQLRILTALTEHIEEGTTLDAGGIMRAPLSDFTCPQLLAQEQDVYFRKTPLLMGFSSELPEPNTYWADKATGIPILMVRDGESQFRAYANVCRHRGNIVVPEGRGSKDSFSCPFHAWTYANDGTLLAINQNRHFGNVSRLELPLIELPSAEMYGTLWVRPIPGDPIDEDECLGGLQNDLAYWQISTHPRIDSYSINVRANWKIAVDTYGENYHLNILHAQSVGKEVKANLQTCDRFGKNLRLVYPNQKFDLMRFLVSDPGRWPYKQITSTLYFIYPNVIMIVDAFGIDLLRIFPGQNSPSNSRTIHTWYIDPKVQPHIEKLGISYEERITRFRDIVVNEDYGAAANIQCNSEAGIQSEILLGRNEEALQHIHNTHRSALGRDLLQIETG